MIKDINKLCFLPGSLLPLKDGKYPYISLLKQGLTNLGIIYPQVSTGDLPVADILQGDEVVEILQGGNLVKTTVQDIADLSRPFALTYSAAEDLVQNQTVVVGQQYLITDRADTGILLTGTSDNSFSIEGSGGFLNPDYQPYEGLGDYSEVEVLTGVPYSGTTHGVWRASVEGTYVDGDIVIWGNSHYQVISAVSFNGTNPAANFDAYYYLPKDLFSGYIEEWDKIEFDFTNDHIQKRTDKRGNEVGASFSILSSITDPISLFKWGSIEAYGNKVSESSFHCCNNVGQLVGNIVEANAIITFNSPIRSMLSCTFTGNITHDLTSASKSYNNKYLSEHLSTFDATISYSFSGSAGSVVVPNYIGIINLDSLTPGDTINGISTNVSFERTFYSLNSTNSVVFDDSGTLLLTSPTITLSNSKEDFIKFLMNINTSNFAQTGLGQF